MNHYFQVNWVNGMKVSSGHFLEMENHFINRSQILAKGFVNAINYGLLPTAEKDKTSSRFSLLLSEEKIRIHHDLLAVTPDGYLVQIPASTEFPLSRAADNTPPYYLVLSVDSYTRIPYGEINEQESPLRYPFAIPEYHFQFLPVQESTFHTLGYTILPIAKFKNTSLEEDPGYIPPCSSIQSSPTLVSFYNDMLKTLTQLEKTTINLLSARVVAHKPLLMNLIEYFNLNKAAIEWYIPFLPPVFLMEKIVQVASILYSYVEIELKTSREDEMRRILSKIINLKYNHLDIASAVNICRTFSGSYSKFLIESGSITP
jgi:predicted component of type VI protein secretion system